MFGYSAGRERAAETLYTIERGFDQGIRDGIRPLLRRIDALRIRENIQRRIHRTGWFLSCVDFNPGGREISSLRWTKLRLRRRKFKLNFKYIKIDQILRN